LRFEIRDLLLKGAIECCTSYPTVVSVFSECCAKKGYKWRIVVNLRPLNKKIVLQTFRKQDIRPTMALIETNDVMTTIDPTDFFHQVP
jgi:hypothetical protein